MFTRNKISLMDFFKKFSKKLHCDAFASWYKVSPITIVSEEVCVCVGDFTFS